MKITKSFLKKLIAEEVRKAVAEQMTDPGDTGPRIPGRFKNRRVNAVGTSDLGKLYVGDIDGVFHVKAVSETTGEKAVVPVAENLGFSTSKAQDYLADELERVGFLKDQSPGPRDFIRSMGPAAMSLVFHSASRFYQGRNRIDKLTKEESSKSDNEIILEAHRKGRKLSPAVKKLWWLDA